jgi:hypothetical protein
MNDEKADQLKPYVKPEVRELGTGEAQSVALLTLIAKAAAGSLNNALHSIVMQIDMLTKSLGRRNQARAEQLARLSAAANRAVRLSRVIFGTDKPNLDEAYSRHAEQPEETSQSAD